MTIDMTVPSVETSIDEQLAQFTSKSDKIRHLTSIGWKRSDIAKKLDIRYQHVRNVQLQPLKKG